MDRKIQEAATQAAIMLNNSAIRAPENEWREVQAVCRDLETLARPAWARIHKP